MRVTFIGTSHGIPEPHRKCSCIMLEVGDKLYFIDAGTSPINALIDRGISYDRVNAIFITHLHGDHVDGLINFVDLCTWSKIGKQAKTRIFLPEIGAVQGIEAFLKCTHHGGISPMLSFAEVKEGLIFDDGTIKVTALKTGHMEFAYAYFIEAEGKKLLFTGDMKHDTGPVDDYARFVTEDGLDLAVAECAHFEADLYVEPLRRHPPKRFVFTHYSPRHIESCYRVKSLLEGEIQIIIASDDMEIEV